MSGTKKCSLCREKYDSQFINHYETLDSQKDFIYICEYCEEEKTLYDDEKNMHYIETSNQDYYASYDINYIGI